MRRKFINNSLKELTGCKLHHRRAMHYHTAYSGLLGAPFTHPPRRIILQFNEEQVYDIPRCSNTQYSLEAEGRKQVYQELAAPLRKQVLSIGLLVF